MKLDAVMAKMDAVKTRADAAVKLDADPFKSFDVKFNVYAGRHTIETWVRVKANDEHQAREKARYTMNGRLKQGESFKLIGCWPV